MNKFDLKQIGTIEVAEERCRICVDEEYRAGVAELEGFSHLNVLYWCHYVDASEYRSFVTIPKPYTRGPQSIGVFATRSPVRPNPIALTVCQVLTIDRTAGVITTPYIDAEDGSPLLDIKPYHPAEDRVRDVHVPAWCSHFPMWYEDSASFDWEAEFVHAR